jgi:hypothetical protein
MTTFKRYMDPAAWTYGPTGRGKPPGAAKAPDAGADRMTAEPGFRWQSPAMPSTPFEYCMLRFEARLPQPAYWAAIFEDADGRALLADHYSGVEPSEDWAEHAFCFRGRPGAAAVRLVFQPIRDVMHVRNVQLDPAPRRQVAAWCDRIYAPMPPLAYEPPADRFQDLPRSLAALRAGEDLTFLMLGDSVVNDAANAPIDVLVERHCRPGRIRLIASVSSGGNCQFYSRDDNVRRFILDYEPDLVLIGGISHHGEVEPIAEVVRQVRAAREADLVVATPAPLPDFEATAGKSDPPAEWAGYPQRLAAMAAEQRVRLMDLCGPFEQYVRRCPGGRRWLMRDTHHANARGRQIIARIFERYFAPPAGAGAP